MAIKIFIILSLAVLVFSLGIAAGTLFYPVDASLGKVPQVSVPEDLETYLKNSEAALKPKANTEKTILWAYPDHRKTPLSLIYIHGFSATRGETAPVSEELGKKLGANVFLTRLSGHGLGSAGMGAAKASEWLTDANEALAIGKKLGERVVILGYSTGAALSVYLAAKQDPSVSGIVMMSPNFRPKTPMSLLSSGPLGTWITNLATGGKHTFVTKNPDHAYYWTSEYPAVAIHEMMELLKYVNSIGVQKISTPLLLIYSPRDTVVSVPTALQKFQEWSGSQKKLVEFKTGGHVFAGNILAPEGNEPLESEIIQFVESLK